jgi:hypothetical protein
MTLPKGEKTVSRRSFRRARNTETQVIRKHLSMQKHDLARVEARTKELCKSLADVADDKDFEELLTIIHKPGYTTPAEHAFVLGLVEAMHSHTKTLTELKQVLLTASRAIGTK